jgi:hypothetical protein
VLIARQVRSWRTTPTQQQITLIPFTAGGFHMMNHLFWSFYTATVLGSVAALVVLTLV